MAEEVDSHSERSTTSRSWRRYLLGAAVVIGTLGLLAFETLRTGQSSQARYEIERAIAGNYNVAAAAVRCDQVGEMAMGSGSNVVYRCVWITRFPRRRHSGCYSYTGVSVMRVSAQRAPDAARAKCAP
jgi:hypothetical protein